MERNQIHPTIEASGSTGAPQQSQGILALVATLISLALIAAGVALCNQQAQANQESRLMPEAGTELSRVQDQNRTSKPICNSPTTHVQCQEIFLRVHPADRPAVEHALSRLVENHQAPTYHGPVNLQVAAPSGLLRILQSLAVSQGGNDISPGYEKLHSLAYESGQGARGAKGEVHAVSLRVLAERDAQHRTVMAVLMVFAGLVVIPATAAILYQLIKAG